MRFTYRVGWPFWKWFAGHGAISTMRVGVKYDPEAKVFYVAWSDLPGLCTEADTLEELRANIQDCAELLLAEYLPRPSQVRASMHVPVMG